MRSKIRLVRRRSRFSKWQTPKPPLPNVEWLPCEPRPRELPRPADGAAELIRIVAYANKIENMVVKREHAQSLEDPAAVVDAVAAAVGEIKAAAYAVHVRSLRPRRG